MTTWVNLSEFARIRGCTSQAVKNAITEGRLKNGARQKTNGKWEVCPEVANLEWSLNTNHSMRRNAKDPTQKWVDTTPEPFVKPGVDRAPAQTEQQASIADSRAKLEHFKALLAELEYEEKAETLIEADAVKTAWIKIITETKTKILALPSKAKANIPELSVADVATLERLVRESLEELAADVPA